MTGKIIETERLYLREFTLADAQRMVDLHIDPDVTKYTGDVIPIKTIADAEKVMLEIIFPQYENKIGRWATFLHDDEFIGWCGLKDIGGTIDLGYRFFKKHWGNGYATESAKAVLDYGIRLKLSNIIGRAEVPNKASIRVLEKIGLTFIGQYHENDHEMVKYLWVDTSGN